MSNQQMFYLVIFIGVLGVNLCALGSDHDARRSMPISDVSGNSVQLKPGGPIDLHYTLQTLSDGTLDVTITASSPPNFSTPESTRAELFTYRYRTISRLTVLRRMAIN